MLDKLLSNGKNVLVCWIVFLVWGTYLFNFSLYPQIKKQIQNKDLPEEKIGLTSEYFYDLLDKMDEGVLSSYFNFQLMDYLNGFLLGLVIFATIFYLLKKLKTSKFLSVVLILPILLVIFDLTENSILLYLISNFPAKYLSTVNLLSTVTSSKLIIGSLAFLAMLVVAIAVIAKFFVLWLRVKRK